MKNFFTLIFIFSAIISIGQSFYFEPTATLEKTISLDSQSDLKIHIIRESNIDTLYLDYELISNSTPNDWYIAYCDNHGCWGSLPETGSMSALFDEFNSYIELSFNPLGIEGEGIVEYYVYERGHYSNGSLMTFIVSTPDFVGIEEPINPKVSFYPNPAQDYLTIDAANKIVEVSIYSLTGQQVGLHSSLEVQEKIDISYLNDGIYLINIKDELGNSISKKLRKD